MGTFNRLEPPNRRRIFLMRHGAVKYFARKETLDEHGLARLTDTGRWQAAQVRDALAPVSFDRVFSSPVQRAFDTASIVIEGRGLGIEKIEGFREIAAGNVRHLSPHEMAETLLGTFSDVSDTARFLGGEKFSDMKVRVVQALNDVLGKGDWQTILIVAHEAVNRGILAHALGADLAVLDHLEQEECCINVLDIDPRGHTIVRLMNYMAYDPLCGGHRTRTLERVCVDLFDSVASDEHGVGSPGDGK